MSLEREDIDRLREIFVTRIDCESATNELKNKQTNESTRLAVIENQLKIITWLLYAVAGGVITMLIKMLFGG